MVMLENIWVFLIASPELVHHYAVVLLTEFRNENALLLATNLSVAPAKLLLTVPAVNLLKPIKFQQPLIKVSSRSY